MVTFAPNEKHSTLMIRHADVNEEETIEVPMSHFVDNLFQKRQIGLEAEWPLYKNSAHLLLQPQ